MSRRWVLAGCLAALCVLLLLAWRFRPIVQVVQNLGGGQSKTYQVP